jgi:hypothetical protein
VRDSGNKSTARIGRLSSQRHGDAHGIGSGGLAVNVMVIGCLGVELRGERFLALSHFREGQRTGRGGELEGRAAAQVACEPTADVSVRGCLCVCARTHHSCGSGLPAWSTPAPAWRSLCAPAGPAAHPADSNSSACAVEMSTVEKSQDTAWNHVLDTKGLSAAAPILEEYGLSCENDMSFVDEEDLVVLCSKLKQFQSKLLRKWVQGLGSEQRAAAFMKDASAANKHSTSPPDDKGEEDEDVVVLLLFLQKQNLRRRTGTRTQT